MTDRQSDISKTLGGAMVGMLLTMIINLFIFSRDTPTRKEVDEAIQRAVAPIAAIQAKIDTITTIVNAIETTNGRTDERLNSIIASLNEMKARP